MDNVTTVQLEGPTDPVSIAEGQRRFLHTPERQDGRTGQPALYIIQLSWLSFSSGKAIQAWS